MILICGLPRAGKTTLSEKYENVIHLDRVGTYSCVNSEVSTKRDMTVDGVYDNKLSRTMLLRASKDERNICIWVNTDLDTVKKRGNTYFHRFEPPTLDEGWDEIIMIRGDNVESIHR